MFGSIYRRATCRVAVISKRLSNAVPPTRRLVARQYFITTPIFYVNAVPHIGHLYSALLADASARWNRLKGFNVIYSTGTDEHGLKIQNVSQNADKHPKVFCDDVSLTFKNLFEESNISYTDFVRTTEQRHKGAVQQFWETLESGGFLYTDKYQGWYSTQDECFLTESNLTDQTLENGSTIRVSTESGHIVEWMEETNYIFRLSLFREKLLKWLDSNVIHPFKFEAMVRKEVSGSLPDLSVSRQCDRLWWGISVPGDKTQTIYVWLDALVNYLTVAGYPGSQFNTWPPDCHVIGQDIIKFHAIYWPAFLMAAGLDPPQKIVCHSHWLMDHTKMSKSKGNVVDPMRRIKHCTADGFRYFLLKQGILDSDSNYSDKELTNYVNADLCNTLGNLLSRSTNQSMNPSGKYPRYDHNVFIEMCQPRDLDMMASLNKLRERVTEHYDEFYFCRGIKLVMSQLHETNNFFQRHEPWKLKNDSNQMAYLGNVIYVSLETLRICGVLLQPIVPDLANSLLNQLGVGTTERGIQNAYSSCYESGGTKECPYVDRTLRLSNRPLFPRLTPIH